MSMMLGNPCDFIRNLWLLSGLLTSKINQSILNFRKAATTAQCAPRFVIGKSLANFASFEGLPFFSNAQLKLMSYNIRKRNMDFHMTSWAIGKMAFEVISQVFLGVIKFSKKVLRIHIMVLLRTLTSEFNLLFFRVPAWDANDRKKYMRKGVDANWM